jgi:hypothetical protein
MTESNFRKKIYDGKSSSKLSEQHLKEIEEKAVFALWYTDENGDEVTSYWSRKDKAEQERKSLQEHGYTVSEVFKR